MHQPHRNILNLGSGRKKIDGAVNLDVVSSTAPDVVHDLNVYPWPFERDTFDEVVANDVIEHLVDVIKTMEELHRICRPHATVKVTVPHYSCANAFADPTHKHYFSSFSFSYFTDEHQFSFYSQCRFVERHSRIVFMPTLANKIVSRLANRYRHTYESRWAWIFPAWFLYFELEVTKEESSRIP